MPNSTTDSGLSLRQLIECKERVFPSYPQVARYFPAASIEDARHRLGRVIERGDGPGLVIGGPGTGKSLLLQVLASQYHERFDVVLPACARLCTRRALLQAILFELGLPYRVRDEGDLRLSLLDHLLSREECPTGLLLLVDEAQTLSINLLDELRVLTNLVRGGLPRVRLVLAGSSALEECFAHPELESFSQRLAARCYLGPFGREETAQFVRAEIAACGGSPEVLFTPDAWDAIFEATDGVPRLVNQLCDRALMDADTANRSQIDRSVIQSAWADIQQLPAPWDTPAPTTAPPAPLQVVEFGQLDDDLVVGRDRIGEVVVADQFEDEVLPDIEPTELDPSDDEVTTTTEAASTKSDSAQPVRDSSNPFAEEFDEEEVVLDNFASWDNMFHSDALRVENRRDPEFAALVQAAVSEADVNETVACASTGAALRMLEEDSEEYDSTATELAVSKVPDTDAALDCQRPRLAIVSDSASETREPTSSVDDAAFSSDDWNASNSESREVASWSPDDWSDGEHLANQTANHHEEPVLIVEDDTAAPKPPVRREEYRNLFSRLRSG